MGIVKNIFIFIFLSLLVGSCATPNEDDKIAQLAEYKQSLTELKKTISDLEAEIEKEQGVSGSVVNVATKIIVPESYHHYIEVTGKVKADKNTVVSPEGAGIITRIVVVEGERVSKGQILAYLNTDAIESQIKEVKVNLELAETTFTRRQKLWDQHIGSEIEYLQAKSNKESLQQKLNALEAQLAMTTVKSQISGVVDEIYQKTGEIAGPGLPFAQVVNINTIYVSCEVGERFLGKVKNGDSTFVYFPAIDKTVKAQVLRSSTVINDISRTFRVRINLNNRNHEIVPNLIAVVKMKVFSADNLLIVPSILVKQDFEGEFVFVCEEREGKTYARKQYVKSIFNSDNSTIISEGLNSGDALVTQGYDQIVNGTEISIVNS
jgi:RND family efflux transporter MFP subunit